MIALIMWYR